MHGHANIINPTTFIARTTAQACRSAGVARAYEELLDFEGSAAAGSVPPIVGPTSYRERIAAYPTRAWWGMVPAGADRPGSTRR